MFVMQNPPFELNFPSEYSRLFKFKSDTDCSDNNLDELQVKIPEILHPHYGMYTWPSAVVLAQYLWYYRCEIRGRFILELGAGTALPGVVAAKCGAQVILSDSMWLPGCLENCLRSCLANDLHNVTISGITWGCCTPELLSLKNLHYIIASDCFYDTKDFENILATVALLLERNPGSKFLCTYQIRCTNWTIGDLLAKWHLVCISIPLSSFGADSPQLAESNLPGRHTIQMLQMMPDTG